MTMIDSLAISIPTLLAVFGFIISLQNYQLSKRKIVNLILKKKLKKLKLMNNDKKKMNLD